MYVVPLASTGDVAVAAGARAAQPIASFPSTDDITKNFIAGKCPHMYTYEWN